MTSLCQLRLIGGFAQKISDTGSTNILMYCMFLPYYFGRQLRITATFNCHRCHYIYWVKQYIDPCKKFQSYFKGLPKIYKWNIKLAFLLIRFLCNSLRQNVKMNFLGNYFDSFRQDGVRRR